MLSLQTGTTSRAARGAAGRTGAPHPCIPRARTRSRFFHGAVLALGLLAGWIPAAAFAQQLSWARDGRPTSGIGQGSDVAVDAVGDAYVVGYYTGSSLVFGASGSSPTALTSAFGVASFVAKFAADGSLLWARNLVDGNSLAGLSVTTDAASNALLTGAFSGTLVLGAGPSQVILTSSGDSDVLVAKYDASGALLWARSAGGAGFDLGVAIATDADGRVRVTGEIGDTARFGAGDPNETQLASPGAQSGFLASYESNGELRWARVTGGEAQDLAVDGAGDSYVSGLFEGSEEFGATPGSATLSSSGWEDAFAAKYDRDGALQWARRAGGPGFDVASGIATDGSGGAYVGGSFEFDAVFGPGEPGERTLANDAVATLFLARLDASGSLQWVRAADGFGESRGFGVAADARGGVYLAGPFLDGIVLGAGEPNETALVSVPSAPFTINAYDVFLAKYDSGGTLQWARSDGGAESDVPYALALAGDQYAYLTGWITGEATFGAGEPNQTQLGSSTTPRAVFAARYALGDGGHGPVDRDGDGVPDSADNCPSVANPAQTDRDHNGFGDACVPLGSLDRRARLGRDPVIGAGSRLARGVHLADGVRLGNDVILERDVHSGDDLTVGSGTQIGRGSQFGERVQLGAGVRIERDARIGSDVVIEDGARIGQDARIADGARVRAGAVIGRDAVLGWRSEVGRGSTVQRGLQLGEDASLGERVVFGRDVVVGARVKVGDRARVGSHSKLGVDSCVGADAVLGAFVTVRPRAVVPPGAKLPQGTVFP